MIAREPAHDGSLLLWARLFVLLDAILQQAVLPANVEEVIVQQLLIANQLAQAGIGLPSGID